MGQHAESVAHAESSGLQWASCWAHAAESVARDAGSTGSDDLLEALPSLEQTLTQARAELRSLGADPASILETLQHPVQQSRLVKMVQRKLSLF